jgi:hypothetical protein
MRRLIHILAALLMVQVVLAVVLDRAGPDLSPSASDNPMIVLDGKPITRLVIDGIDSQVTLEKKSDHWVIPTINDFSADQDKVAELINKLKSIKRNLPVSTSEASRERFRVADEGFERRIQVFVDASMTAEIFLGTAPRSRMIHVRLREDTAVFETQMGLHHASATTQEWLDKALLQVAYPDIRAISVPGVFRLEKDPNAKVDKEAGDADQSKAALDRWVSADPLGENERIEQSSILVLGQKIANIRLKDVLGTTIQSDYGLSTPKLVLQVETSAGQTLIYELGLLQGADDYVLKISNRPEYFALADYSGKGLLDAADRSMIFLPKLKPISN